MSLDISPIGPTMNPAYTIPKQSNTKQIFDKTPDHMRPSLMPYAVVAESVLSAPHCEAIVKTMNKLNQYRFPGCDAITRECPRPLSYLLDPVVDFSLFANRTFFQFDLDDSPAAWLQSYGPSSKYALHTDGALGQSRKLTTIVMLTDPTTYEGGQLRIVPYPEYEYIPPTQGTMVTFPSWLLHEVLPVKSGNRQTINMGFWGPPFK